MSRLVGILVRKEIKMETQSSVLLKIDELVAYAKSQGKDADKMSNLMTPLVAAVILYYDEDITPSVTKAIEAITHGLIRTGIIYTDGSSASGGGTPPAGWSDVRSIFIDVDKSLMSTTKEAFNASIHEVTPPAADGESTAEPYYESNLVNTWISEYSAAGTSVINSLAAIAQYGNSVGLGNSIQNLLEPKEVKTVPSLVDIAKDIYLDKGYKELIQTRGIDIYVPTAAGGE